MGFGIGIFGQPIVTQVAHQGFSCGHLVPIKSYKRSTYGSDRTRQLTWSTLIHVVIASSMNIGDSGENNLAVKYGLPMTTSCKNCEKTDSAPLTLFLFGGGGKITPPPTKKMCSVKKLCGPKACNDFSLSKI